MYFAGKKNVLSVPINTLQQEITNILSNNKEAFEKATDETQKTKAFGVKQVAIEKSLKAFLEANPDFTMQYNVVTPGCCNPALQNTQDHPRTPLLIEFSKMEKVKIVFDYINDIPADNPINPDINQERVTHNKLEAREDDKKNMDKFLGATYTLYNPKTGERFSIGTSAVKQLPQAGEVSATVSTFKPLPACIATAYSANHKESLSPPLYVNGVTGKEDKILNKRSVAFKASNKETYQEAARKTEDFVRENKAKPKEERIEKLANYINEQDNILQKYVMTKLSLTFYHDFLRHTKTLNQSNPEKCEVRKTFFENLTSDPEGFKKLKERYSNSSRLQSLTDEEGVALIKGLKPEIATIETIRGCDTPPPALLKLYPNLKNKSDKRL